VDKYHRHQQLTIAILNARTAHQWAVASIARFAIKECTGLIGNVLLHVPLVPWHTTMNIFARKHPALLLTTAQLPTTALQGRVAIKHQISNRLKDRHQAVMKKL